MKKTNLLKTKEVAEEAGEDDKVSEIQSQLEELEERATELDRRRTSNINSIRSVFISSSFLIHVTNSSL